MLGADKARGDYQRTKEVTFSTLVYTNVPIVHEGESGMPIAAERHYHFDPQRGLVPTQKIHAGQTLFSGADLLAFARGDFTDSARRSAKLLCRAALHVHLGGKPLQTRSLFSS